MFIRRARHWQGDGHTDKLVGPVTLQISRRKVSQPTVAFFTISRAPSQGGTAFIAQLRPSFATLPMALAECRCGEANRAALCRRGRKANRKQLERRHSEMLASWHEAPSTFVACVLYGRVVPEVSTLSGQQEGTGIDSASARKLDKSLWNHERCFPRAPEIWPLAQVWQGLENCSSRRLELVCPLYCSKH